MWLRTLAPLAAPTSSASGIRRVFFVAVVVIVPAATSRFVPASAPAPATAPATWTIASRRVIHYLFVFILVAEAAAAAVASTSVASVAPVVVRGGDDDDARRATPRRRRRI